MELTQADYEERKVRIEDGTGDDEDARLVKHYERQGFAWDGKRTETSSDTTPSKRRRSAKPSPSNAPTTSLPSSKPQTDDSTVSSTDGVGRTSESSGDDK